MRLRDLGSERFQWQDLRAIIRALWNDRDSALFRVRNAHREEWSRTDELLAGIFDVLNWTAWTKTKSAQKNGRPPKPIPRPSNNFGKSQQGRLKGAVSLPVDELKRQLALPRISE